MATNIWWNIQYNVSSHTGAVCWRMLCSMALGCWMLGMPLLGNADETMGQGNGGQARDVVETVSRQTTLPVSSSSHYERRGRRDPFIPLIDKGSVHDDMKTGLSDTPRSSLGIRVIGIMSGILGYRALIQLSDGKRHIVEHGSIVGPRRGRITSINEQDVVIEWPATRKEKEKRARHTVLKIATPP